jgi:MFS family permease
VSRGIAGATHSTSAVTASWHRNQAALMVASFVGFTGFTLVMPFLALHFQALGETDVGTVAAWTGVTLGVTPLVAALCAPLWGRVGDRFGNKILIQRSLASFVLVMGLMAVATQSWQLFALRALQGLVAGYGALAIAMAARSAPREKMATAIGWVQTAQRVAPAFGPVVGGLLSPVVGLRNTFLVAALVYALAFVLFSYLYREPPTPAVARKGTAPVAFSNILSFENFLLLMIVIFGLQMVDRSLAPVMLLHLEALGYDTTAATRLVGVLFSLLALSGAAGNQLAAAALARASARVVITAAALVAAAALAWFAFTADQWALIATISVVGACLGVATTAAFTAAGTVIPIEAHGASFGFLTGASLIGSAAGAMIAGLVAAQSMRVVFVAGVVVLAGLAFVVRRVMADSGRLEPVAPVDEY